MTEKVTIRIGMSSKIDVWRDGEWTILYIEDGSGAKTTMSLGPLQAIDLATLLVTGSLERVIDTSVDL